MSGNVNGHREDDAPLCSSRVAVVVVVVRIMICYTKRAASPILAGIREGTDRVIDFLDQIANLQKSQTAQQTGIVSSICLENPWEKRSQLTSKCKIRDTGRR